MNTEERQAILNAIDNTVECRDNELRRLGTRAEVRVYNNDVAALTAMLNEHMTTKEEKTMRLEMNKKYETRDGTVFKVVHIIDARHTARYPVVAIAAEQGPVRTFTLEGLYDTGICAESVKHLVREHTKEDLLCGYTKEQWKFIIDGNFLCGFSNNEPQKSLIIQTLNALIPIEGGYKFMAHGDTTWSNCSPVRQAGIRQPWFGGECPISDDMMVLVMLRDGSSKYGLASCYEWDHVSEFHDIVEFVYLERFAEEQRQWAMRHK